jgi:hypothetical protein
VTGPPKGVAGHALGKIRRDAQAQGQGPLTFVTHIAGAIREPVWANDEQDTDISEACSRTTSRLAGGPEGAWSQGVLRRPPHTRYDPKAVRKWAAFNRVDVPARGRIRVTSWSGSRRKGTNSYYVASRSVRSTLYRLTRRRTQRTLLRALGMCQRIRALIWALRTRITGTDEHLITDLPASSGRQFPHHRSHQSNSILRLP